MISGDVVCSKCQHIFSFSAIENFFTKKANRTDLERSKDIFMKSKPRANFLTISTINKNAVPIREISSIKFDEIRQHLGIDNITSAAFEGIQTLCDFKEKSLYFLMQDAYSNIVGYKKLYRKPNEKLIETTFPESNSYGAVVLPPFAKRGSRDSRTAIIVLNMLDALAIRMEKRNSKIFEKIFDSITCKSKQPIIIIINCIIFQ